MMGYLDRLKGMNSEKRPPSLLQELQKTPFDSFCSSHGARSQKITPPDHATPEPERVCSTCAHACRSGCCGEPVRAGLSPVEGVIRYGHADTCEAFEERAAIMEYDGGLTRDEAERQSLAIVERVAS